MTPHAGVESLDLRFGMDVEQRIGRAFAAEADDTAIEAEIAPGELIIAADQVGSAGEARRVGRPADRELGRPAAVDAEPAHVEVAARDVQVEPPRVKLRDLDHIDGVEPAVADLQLRNRGGGTGPAKLEAALVERQFARDRAPFRVERMRSGPVTRAAISSRLSSRAWRALKFRSSKLRAAREGHRARPVDRAAAAGPPGQPAEHQPGDPGTGRRKPIGR